MARFGSIMKGIGKGARAVGRAGMRGLLGFDDRDLRRKKPAAVDDVIAEEYDETTGETNPDFTGVNRGAWMPDAVESDGLIEETPEMEAPPDIGMEQESVIGDLQMPTLPGMPRRGRKGGAPRIVDMSGSSVQFKPADDNDAPPMPLGRGKYANLPGFTPETAPGGAGERPTVFKEREEAWYDSGPGGEGGRSYGPEEMDAAAEGAMKGLETAGTLSGVGGLLGLGKAGAKSVYGAFKAGRDLSKARQFVNASGSPVGGLASKVPIKGQVPGAPLRPPMAPTTGYTSSPGVPVGGPPMPRPPAGPGRQAIEGRLNAFRQTYKPKGPDDFHAPGGKGYSMPGQPGMEGPLEYIPGATITRGGRMMGRGPNNQFGWLLD